MSKGDETATRARRPFAEIDEVVDALLDQVTELESVLDNYVRRYGATELSRPSRAKGRRVSAAVLRVAAARSRG